MADNLIVRARQIGQGGGRVTKLKVWWTRAKFNMSSSLRAEFYTAIADNTAMENRFTESLAVIFDNDTNNGRSSPSTTGTLCQMWLRALTQEGVELSTLVRAWTPSHDALILEAIAEGPMSEKALRDLADATSKIGGWGMRMALAFFPGFAVMAGIFWALQMLGKMAVESLQRYLKNIDGVTQAIFSFSLWLKDGGILSAYILSLGIPTLIFLSLPRWKSFGRSTFDNVWPFSLYREIQTGLCLRALSELLQAPRRRIPDSLERIAQAAPPYLRHRLLAAARHGDAEMGRQFDSADLNFPSPLVRRQLRQLVNAPDPAATIRRISDSALARADARVRFAASVAGWITTIAFALFAVWLQMLSTSQQQSMQVPI